MRGVSGEPFSGILGKDSIIFRLTAVHENARSALECDSEAAALIPNDKAVAVRRLTDTALQGASGTTIIMAKNLALLCSALSEISRGLSFPRSLSSAKAGERESIPQALGNALSTFFF